MSMPPLPPPVFARAERPDRAIAIGAFVIAGAHALLSLMVYGGSSFPMMGLHVVDGGVFAGAVVMCIGWSRTMNQVSADMRVISGLGLAAAIGMICVSGLSFFASTGMFGNFTSFIALGAAACICIAATVHRSQCGGEGRAHLVVLAWIALAANLLPIVTHPSSDSLVSVILFYTAPQIAVWTFAGLAILVQPPGVERVPTATVIHQ
jgi:hypothetical protein